MTTSFLKPHGEEPSTNEQLTDLVTEDRRISMQCFTGKLAKDPRKGGLVEESMINLWISSSETFLNSMKGSGIDLGGSTYSQVAEKPSHIFIAASLLVNQ